MLSIPPARVSLGDELVKHLAELGLRHGLTDHRVVDQPADSVAAEQQPVTLLQSNQAEVRLVGRLTVENLQQQGSVRVHCSLGRADLAVVDEGLDPAVVMGQTLQPAVPEEIGATVTDVGQTERDTVEERTGDCGAHALQGVVILDKVGDPVVRPVDGPREDLEHLLALGPVVDLAEGVDRHSRSKITRSRPAHAVGHHQQVRAGVAGVLVVLAYQADLGMGDETQPERHQGSSFMIVFPMRIVSARLIVVGAVIRWPLTYVPFVEPRSST